MLVVQTRQKTIHIAEVACAWNPLVKEREKQKQAKYQHLKSDFAKQYEGYRVYKTPIVIDDLGLICETKRYLIDTKLLQPKEAERFLATAQREVLVQNVQILKRHLAE